ncbi:MAG: fucose isomerase [Calditrichaeota bacterium]|nr:MAG: fucose isomerase [Calditrichota bacterium]
MQTKKPTFAVVVGNRGFFSAELAVGVRKVLLAKLQKMGFDTVILPENETKAGAVETIAEAEKYARLFRQHAEKIDGVIISLANFGDELGIVNTLRYANLNVPILVQACDDDLDKVSVSERRDAFCGKLSVCNNLYQYGIPFTDTTLHTCAVESETFTHDLDFFARVCRVVKGMKNARIGAIGVRPAAFQTMRFSEKLFQASGITVVPVDLSDIIAAAKKQNGQSNQVQQKLQEIRAYGTIPDSVRDEAIHKQACLSVAVEEWMAANNIDAAGMQCWTSIQENYGCAICLTMSMLGDKNKPCACEVDLGGVLGMYALNLATEQPSALLDWNNNYGDQRDKCINTHCSNYPKGFINAPVEISTLDILGATLGPDCCFGAVKGKVAAGPMTYFRVSTDDVHGKIRAYLGEGDFTDDPCAMDGGIAVCRIPRLRELLRFMCKNGFEHHVGMVRGHCADVIQEAVDSYLNWNLYRHL